MSIEAQDREGAAQQFSLIDASEGVSERRDVAAGRSPEAAESRRI